MKRLVVFLITIITVFTAAIGIAGAQDPTEEPQADRPRGVGRIVIEIISDATGLTPREIREELAEGKTLATIITENGGDVEAVKQEIEAAVTEELSGQLENVGQLVDEALNGEFRDGRPGGRDREGGERRRPGGALLDAVAEATGLTEEEIQERLEADETLAAIITSAGGDPAAVIETAKAAVQERLAEEVAEGNLTQEEADERLANLDARFNELLNTPRSELVADEMVNVAVVRAIAETLNVRPRELREDWTEGQTPADFITAQGGDIEAVKTAAKANLETMLDRAVENGRMTQEQADSILAGADAAIDEVMNSAFEPRVGGGQRGGGRPRN